MTDEMDDVPSDSDEPEYKPEPRITNRAQGGMHSDKIRFIRPVERQRMRPWLIEHLDKQDIPGLDWQQRDEHVFRISWKHAANQCFNLQTDTNLFERWAIHTGRHQDSDHKRWKANFRCALNSLPDVEELKEQGVKKGNNAFKVYRFLGEQEVKAGKPRRKKESNPMYYMADHEQDSDMMRWRQNSLKTLTKSYIEPKSEFAASSSDQGASSDSEAAKPIPSLPNLHQLVPGGSGVDLLLEADSKEKTQPLVNSVDNLQEILAAATASLEAGGDALALEKISIEQLSRLGEVSKMKLDIRQSDRKRRKKDVAGILNVFLCNWCEKVFPAKVDLFQHFLTIHQDKLLSGEEYGARKHTEYSESLQQEIADLEKKVLGFTQESFPANESEEVIEDGQVVDMSSNNTMTSQEVYLEDQALDLSVAGALARHPAGTQGSIPHPEIVALDLSINSSQGKQKSMQKNGSAKTVLKRRRSQAMDMDYTVKFTNYGLAGVPRTKRQLSLLMKRKEEEEEKQRKQAEAQHSMEDIVHAEILMSLKSASKDEVESESMEVEEGVENIVIFQSGDDDGDETDTDHETNIKEEDASESEHEVSTETDTKVKTENQSNKINKTKKEIVETEVKKLKMDEAKVKTSYVHSQQGTLPTGNASKFSGDSKENSDMTLPKGKSASDIVIKAYKCGICSEGFEDPSALLEHVSKHRTEFRCYVCSMVMHDKDEYLRHLEGHLPKMQYAKTCNKCGEIFPNIEEFAKHEKSHVDTLKGYKCKHCEKIYLDKTSCSACEQKHKADDAVENGRPENVGLLRKEKVDEMGAASFMKVDGTPKIEDTSTHEENKEKNCKTTDQKNLKGESAVNPAAGSVTSTGPKSSRGSQTKTDTLETNVAKKMIQSAHVNVKAKTDIQKSIDFCLLKSSTLNLLKVCRVTKINPDEELSDGKMSEMNTGKCEDVEKQLIRQNKMVEEMNVTEDQNLNIKNSSEVKSTGCDTPILKKHLESEGLLCKQIITQKEKLIVKCGYCEQKMNVTDISEHLKQHKTSEEENKEINMQTELKYICMICNKPYPAYLYNKHVQSHSIYDLSKAESVRHLKHKQDFYKLIAIKELAKNILICNLCYSAFDSFLELKTHVYSHLSPKQIKQEVLETDDIINVNRLNTEPTEFEEASSGKKVDALEEFSFYDARKTGLSVNVEKPEFKAVGDELQETEVRTITTSLPSQSSQSDTSELCLKLVPKTCEEQLLHSGKPHASKRHRNPDKSALDHDITSPPAAKKNKAFGIEQSVKGRRDSNQAEQENNENIATDLDEVDCSKEQIDRGSGEAERETTGFSEISHVVPVSLVKNLYTISTSISSASSTSVLPLTDVNKVKYSARITTGETKLVSSGHLGEDARMSQAHVSQASSLQNVTLTGHLSQEFLSKIRILPPPNVALKKQDPSSAETSHMELAASKPATSKLDKSLTVSSKPATPVVSLPKLSPKVSLKILQGLPAEKHKSAINLATVTPAVSLTKIAPAVSIIPVTPAVSIATVTPAVSITTVTSAVSIAAATDVISLASVTNAVSFVTVKPADSATTSRLINIASMPSVITQSSLAAAGRSHNLTMPAYAIQPGSLANMPASSNTPVTPVLSSVQAVPKLTAEGLCSNLQVSGKPNTYKLMWLPPGVLKMPVSIPANIQPKFVQVLTSNVSSQQTIAPQPSVLPATQVSQVAYSIPTVIGSQAPVKAPTLVNLQGVKYALVPKSPIISEKNNPGGLLAGLNQQLKILQSGLVPSTASIQPGLVQPTTNLLQPGQVPSTTNILHPGLVPSITKIIQPGLLPALTKIIQPCLVPSTTKIIHPGLLPASTKIIQPGLVPSTTKIIQPGLLPASTKAVIRSAGDMTGNPQITQLSTGSFSLQTGQQPYYFVKDQNQSMQVITSLGTSQTSLPIQLNQSVSPLSTAETDQASLNTNTISSSSTVISFAGSLAGLSPLLSSLTSDKVILTCNSCKTPINSLERMSDHHCNEDEGNQSAPRSVTLTLMSKPAAETAAAAYSSEGTVDNLDTSPYISYEVPVTSTSGLALNSPNVTSLEDTNGQTTLASEMEHFSPSDDVQKLDLLDGDGRVPGHTADQQMSEETSDKLPEIENYDHDENNADMFSNVENTTASMDHNIQNDGLIQRDGEEVHEDLEGDDQDTPGGDFNEQDDQRSLSTNIITLYPCAICQQAFTLETILEHSKSHLDPSKEIESEATSLPFNEFETNETSLKETSDVCQDVGSLTGDTDLTDSADNAHLPFANVSPEHVSELVET